jgi:hypothetical protein
MQMRHTKHAEQSERIASYPCRLLFRRYSCGYAACKFNSESFRRGR